jgi:RNA polymerase sigma-70 factor (ECF subfamily)
MARSESNRSRSGRPAAQRFATTHWSLVAAAGRRTSPQSRAALAALCAAYWYPLYAVVRSNGYSADDAQDLTQEFFARLIARNDFAAADRTKGRFRSYLSASLKHFLANARDHARARKRGAGRPPLSLDFASAEARYGREPADTFTAEKAFARRWALTLLDQVLIRLREEFAASGKSEIFERLRGYWAATRTPRRTPTWPPAWR